MSARILVTRAEPGASESETRLKALGFTVLKAPLLNLVSAPAPAALGLKASQGLVFTSANGVRFFAASYDERRLTAWCVGPATEASARDEGFQDVRCAHGDAQDLAALVCAEADPQAGQVLHIANRAAAGDLAKSLCSSGFDAQFVPLYEAQPVQKLDITTRDALERGDVDAILFHSARGAQTFAQLAADTPIDDTVAFGMSAKALSPIRSLGWRMVISAGAPNENALLAAVRDVLTRP